MSAIARTLELTPQDVSVMAPLDDKTREQIVARVLAARSQRPQRLALLKERQQQGLEVAHKCARILKQEFGAARVVLFGSMLNPGLCCKNFCIRY